MSGLLDPRRNPHRIRFDPAHDRERGLAGDEVLPRVPMRHVGVARPVRLRLSRCEPTPHPNLTQADRELANLLQPV